MDIGQRIKELRQKKNMTLEELGDMVGVGKSTVRKWETGQIANMKRDKIANLAAALQTTPAYLMGWIENPSPADHTNFYKPGMSADLFEADQINISKNDLPQYAESLIIPKLKELGYKNADKMSPKQALSNYRLNHITPAINILEELTDENITCNDFIKDFYNESKDLTEEKKQQLLEMAKFFKQQQEKEK